MTIPGWCECGRGPIEHLSSRRIAGGCALCNEMDGRSEREREIIHLLRVSDGPLTVGQIAAELGLKHNTAQVYLGRMKAAGYVVLRKSELVAGTAEVTQVFGEKLRQPVRRSGGVSSLYYLAPVGRRRVA